MKKLFTFFALLFFVGAVAVATQRPAHADSNGILDVSLNGVYGDYKLELFQVGAPYPSRNIILRANGYTGCTWYNLVTTQKYFVRATRQATGQARQSFAFKLIQGRIGAITLDWNRPSFVAWTHDLDF